MNPYLSYLTKGEKSNMAGEEIRVSSGSAPSKSIPQSVIKNVLAVCPDVDPKDVAKDLVITGSATRTINRILDGQFPAAVNVDFKSMPSEKSSNDEVRDPCGVDSSLSKNSSLSANKVMPAVINNNGNDSSDTKKCTDTDDDDDITILHEEQKSLFSALKKRMHAKQSGDMHVEESETLDLHKDGGIFNNNNYELDSNLRKRPVNTKRTSSIVDLSFSADDNDLHVRKKVGHNIKHSSSAINRTANCILREPTEASHGNSITSKLRNGSKQRKNILDSYLHVSDNDTDSCEGTDDFPCILALSSFPHSETTSRSGTPSLSSGSCLDSQDNSEIPFKRKKRSKEEIISQRYEALVKKKAKELERQAKKEAKERERQEKQQIKEQMKKQKEREKLLKKADSMNQKMNNCLDSCIKQILVCIDPEILNGGQLLEESLLHQKLDLLGEGHRLESQLIPASVTWKRAVVEHDVVETLQISTKTSFVDEKHVLVRLTADKFVEMVFQFCEEMRNPVTSVIADDETVSTFCERTLAIYPGRVVTLVIMGLEKYFRDVKLTQTRQFRSAVLGSSSSDNEKPCGKGRKKANKGSGPSVIVSRVDVEEALVDLQLRQPNCRVRMCETEEEFAELLAMFTKAVAEAPFKKRQPETFSFCVEGGEKASIKVSKEGEGLKKVWLQHFQQFRNVSADMAAAIVAIYPTPQSLLQAYRRCDSRVEATKLLQDILVRRGAGVLANSRRIGPELSRRVFLLLTSEDGDMPVK